MGRQRIHTSTAEKQRVYRQRKKLNRNDQAIVDVTKRNEIYCLDALTFLRNIASSSVKIIITSPPYNLRNSKGGFFRGKDSGSRWSNAALRTGYDAHEDNMPRAEYVSWQRECLSEMYRILENDGAIFYNHKPRVQAGLMESPDEIVKGFPVRQIVIWDRGNGFNFNDGYFLPSYEFIYVIVKPDFRLRPGANALRDVWRINPDTGNDHPAPFPVEIPDRILSAVETDLVLDPFMGSGTVAVAAASRGINYIGCDISQKYVDTARERVSQVQLRLFA